MQLIIVESPTKARTLSKFLGGDYQIEASMGHLVDLPPSKLGIDVDHDFKPDYVISKGKELRVKELQDIATKADSIVLATDPDREGEAISWHVASLINKNEKAKVKKEKLKRIVFHEITESAIKDALQHPRDLDMHLVDAQQARRVLDRLVGYKLSPLLWRKIRKGLSAGRVQSVAVRLIAEREREILAFKAQEYWEIVAKLSKGDNNQFDAKLLKIDDGPAEIKNEEQSKNLIAVLEKASYQVSNVETKEVKRNPYPPFTTSTLQQGASNLFGWSAKRTMQIAQSLYEQGLITYHRTDSLNLADEAVNSVRQYISEQYGQSYLPESPRLYKTKSKVAQEAHEAIRPTTVKSLQSTAELDRDQKKLYEVIWKRFVACQMNEARYEQTSVDINTSNSELPASPADGPTTNYLFRANGSKQLFDGWQRVMSNDKFNEEEEKQQLPELVINDKLNLLQLLPSQHFTEPPPRFTEASLIKALEEFGIGRPSTYAPIISTIQERQYVEKLDKKLQPTSLGLAVNDFLVANFPTVMDYQFTAGMEDNLDAIANGDKEWVPVIKEFYGPFEKILDDVGKNAERVKIEVEETGEICPLDGGKVVIRIGRFGKFLACSNFPTCKFTKQFTQKLGMKCPKCGIGEVIIKRTKTKRSFYGCSRYPDCDFASWNKPKIGVSGQQSGDSDNSTNNGQQTAVNSGEHMTASSEQSGESGQGTVTKT